MKKWMLVAILWWMMPTAVYAQAQEFTFTKTGPAAGFQNPVVGRPRTYDSAPSAIQEGNEIKVWYCGGGAPGDPYHTHDSVFYASYNATTGAVIDAPQRVVWPTLNDANDDGDMACAVTVAKHQNPNIANFNGVMSAPQYKMWYECAPRTYRKSDGLYQGCFTQICHAVSDDGIHWRKWEALDPQGGNWRFNQQSTTVENNPVKATAVITIPQIVKDNVQLENRNNKLYAYFGDNAGCNNINNYGVGHPTAITLQPQPDGFQKIKLWYYDSQGDWNSRAMTYVESWDGFHFSAPVKATIQSPNKIKYVNVPLAGHTGFYLSTMGGFDLNFFNYSWDGINWFWRDGGSASFYTDYLANHFNLGSVTSCSGYGNVVAADPYGWVNSLTNIKVLTTEGGRGPSDGCNQGSCACYNKEEEATYCYDTNSFVPLDQPCNARGSRGNTWNIYTLTGNLNFVAPTSTPKPINTPTPAPKPGDLNGDGKVDSADFTKIVAEFGHPYTIFDYNILVGNFGK